MRAELSTIQQTLTPEAASILNSAIAESGRRDHVQTTPLHVAAALLLSPTGFLRQACIKSHPNSSHPLQCRALELCFSVALERLPTSQNGSPATNPPISNALMAALKRAQAHQRRGCPEQQQQPLLAVKVQLEQLIISILDDPSVSRVMKEASFSSPAVKATIEQSLNSPPLASKQSPLALNFCPTNVVPAPVNRNPYMNPRFQHAGSAQSNQQRGAEIKKVVDVLLRTKKKNPILVGESEPEVVTTELLMRIENKEIVEGPLQNIQVIHLEKEIFSDKEQIPTKIKELETLVKTQMADVDGGRGVILNLGDLKWLAEQPGSFPISDSGRVEGRIAVAEMGKLLARLGESITRRLWLIGTATCETYLRCQIYHPSLENDWDLQALPMAAKLPLPGLFPRPGPPTIVSNSVECLFPMKGFPVAASVNPMRTSSENPDSVRKTSCCPSCRQNYKEELAKLVAMEAEQSAEVKQQSAQPPLPQWLQDVKANDNSQDARSDTFLKKKIQEVEKKWVDICYRLHSNFHHFSNLSSESYQPEQRLSSPVRVDLVLGQTRTGPISSEKTHKERTKDFLACISSPEPERNSIEMQSNKLFSEFDTGSYKKLLKGLMEKVWWQEEAASAIAAAVAQCKWGNWRRQDMWLFFIGPDRVGKKKMVSCLSELLSGSNPFIISLGSRRNDGESNVNFRGKTALDRISEAVRRNSFSVIMIEDIDEADSLTRGSIKSAIERGRIIDSYGREITLGNVVFVLTSNWLPDNLKYPSDGILLDEEKLARLAKGNWQLRLSLSEKTIKRKPDWLNKVISSRKLRKETIGFDLNEIAGGDDDDDFRDASHSSSDLTIEHDDEHNLRNHRFSTSRELINIINNSIVFKPVDYDLIKHHITASIANKFSSIVGDRMAMEIQEEAIEKIMSGVWLGNTWVEEWTDKVLASRFEELANYLPDKSTVVKLELDSEMGSRGPENLLPSSIKLVINK